MIYKKSLMLLYWETVHSQFKNIDVRRFFCHGYGVVYDVKGVLGTEAIDGRL